MQSVALITGAAGGVGKAFANECASRGSDLLLTDLHAPQLLALAEGMQRLHRVDAVFIPCDLTDAPSRDAFWAEVGRLGLQVHFLVNAAGVEFEGPFLERSLSEIRTLLRLNIEATVDTTHRALSQRDPARTLHVINISSLAGFYPMPLKALYSASKRFLIDFSRSLRQELRPRNVRVMALCPSGMPTNPATTRRLLAQGIIGQISMLNAGAVAARAVDEVIAGRDVYVPGVFNRFLRLLGGLLPPSIVTAFIWRRWSAARRPRDRKNTEMR